MTDQEIVDYYKNLLIIQYKGKSKAEATIDALVTQVISNQIILGVRDAFDPNTAVGVQLDILGKYVGIDRVGKTFSGEVSLTDDEYRVAIKIKIIQNNFGSSLAEITELIFQFFGTLIKVYDNENMRMSYLLDSSLGPQTLAEFFVLQGLLPKPMAVGLSSTIYTDEEKFYGYRTYASQNLEAWPLSTYDTFTPDKKWLSYNDTINPDTAIKNKFLLESGDLLLLESGDSLLLENQED